MNQPVNHSFDAKDVAEAYPRLLITGGAGFIGGYLVERLLAAGARVTVLDDLSTGRIENLEKAELNDNFKFIQASVTDEDTVSRLTAEADLIFHLAASVGVKRIMEEPVHCIETNFYGTDAVFRAALSQGAKVVVTSTSEIYGKSVSVPFREDDDAVLGPTSRGRWAYAASKMVSEFLALAYVRERGLDVVVARLFNTVGPRQTGRYGMVIPRFVEQALSGRPLTVFGNGSQSRCFLHVHDAVEALLRLAVCQEGAGKVFNVGSTREMTILGLAGQILNLVDEKMGRPKPGSVRAEPDYQGYETARGGRIVFIPGETVYSGGFEDMDRRLPDTTRIREYTGWRPRLELEDVLEEVVAEMRARS